METSRSRKERGRRTPSPGRDDVALLLAVLDAEPNPVWVTAESGSIVLTNAAFQSSFGAVTATGMTPAGEPWQDADVRARMAIAERTVRRTGQPMLDPLERLAVAGGGTRGFDLLRRRVALSGGETAVVTIATAADAREEAESRAATAESRLDAMLTAAPSAILIIDGDLRVTAWNAEAERLLGWRAIDVVGRQLPFRHFVQGGARHDVRDLLASELSASRVEATLYRRDGAQIEVELAAVAVRSGDGRPAGSAVFLEEVGERRRAEEQLRIRERAIASVATGVVILDARAVGLPIISANEAFERISGYGAADLIGRGCDLLFGPETAADQRARLAEASRPGGGGTFTVRCHRKNGEQFWNEMSFSPITGPSGDVTHIVATSQDVTERRQAAEALEHLAYYDPVTDLPNRTLMRQRAQMAIARSRESGTPSAALVVDLHGLRQIEKLGHGIGDFVLQVIGVRLVSALPETAVVGRLRGDQFGILLEGDTALAAATARRIVAALEQSVTIEEVVLHVEGSVGIAVYPENGRDGQSLLRCAELAARHAEQSGIAFASYSADLDDGLEGTLTLLGQLRSALEAGELLLHYQAALDLRDRRIRHAEALIRWDHPTRGLVMPGGFVPMAEQSSLVRPLTLWVVRAALTQLRSWLDANLHVGISINLSARNLHDQRLVGDIEGLLAEYGIPASLLTFEVTESALMADLAQATNVLQGIKSLGADISIDDFGTGYSSYSYLRGSIIDEIKIDRMFVSGMLGHPRDRMIVRSIIQLGHDLGLRVVAEGAETAEVVEMLASMGCDVVQGYEIARPAPADHFAALVRDRERHAA